MLLITGAIVAIVAAAATVSARSVHEPLTVAAARKRGFVDDALDEVDGIDDSSIASGVLTIPPDVNTLCDDDDNDNDDGLLSEACVDENMPLIEAPVDDVRFVLKFDDANDLSALSLNNADASATEVLAGSPSSDWCVQGDCATGSMVTVDYSTSPSARPQLTVGMWVAPSAADIMAVEQSNTVTTRALFSYNDGNFDRVIALTDRNTDGTAEWHVYTGPTPAFQFEACDVADDGPGCAVVADQLTFIAVTWDESTKRAKLYVGANASSPVGELIVVDANTNYAAGSVTAQTTFGNIRNTAGINSVWTGTMDNAFVYDRVLTPDELQSMYIAGGSNIAE